MRVLRTMTRGPDLRLLKGLVVEEESESGLIGFIECYCVRDDRSPATYQGPSVTQTVKRRNPLVPLWYVVQPASAWWTTPTPTVGFSALSLMLLHSK